MSRRFTRLSFSDAGNPTRIKYTSDKLMSDLETAFDAVDSSIAALAAAAAAQATANTAVTNAATAQTTANTVKRDDAITVSWTVPNNIITATDAGTNVTIVVAAHTRFYGDGAQLSIGGHTFTAKAYSTSYGIYYDDTTRSNTTPTYQITTTLSHAQNSFVAGRHRVGEVDTPASGGAATSGGSTPPGSVSDPSSGRYPTY